MPLQLILGPANSAKAGVVLAAYRAAATRDALLVVPTSADAAHYDRELTAAGTSLGRALTFPALIAEVARRANHNPAVLTPLQRERIVARSLSAEPPPTFAASASSDGFAVAAARLIGELGAARISAPRFAAGLRQWAQDQPQDAQRYATDLGSIYLRYAHAIERTAMVDEQQFAWGALDALRREPACWGTTAVFFYGFDDLTDLQIDTVETLARAAAAHVTVSLTFEQDREVLKGRARVAADLAEIADSVRDLPALDSYYEPESRAALHHLERYLFEPAAPKLEPGGAAVLIEAGGALAEAEQVAADVVTALREGVPASEIVVVTRSLAQSGQLLARTLSRYGVSATSSARLPLAHTRIGRALLTALRLAYGQDPAAVTTAELGTFLRAWSDSSETLDGVDAYEAALRRGGIESAIRALDHPALRRVRSTTAGAALALVDRLRREPRPAALIARAAGELLTLDPLDARAATAILSAISDLAALDGELGTGGPELLATLEQLTVAAALPAENDPVLIAEPLEIRARRFRRVLVTGLCEGEFPSGVLGMNDPFLGDDRRFQIAQAAGLRIPQLEDPLQRERYLLYACVSRATERVTFSYRTSDEEGNIETPSPFISDVCALFTGALSAGKVRRSLGDVSWSPETAPTAREQRLATAIVAGEQQTDRMEEGVAETRTLSRDALAQVRHADVVSAGALVKFARCPVRWLVENQLRPQGLDPDADPLARGNFMHTLLERTLSSLAGPLTRDNLDDAVSSLRRIAVEIDHDLAPGQDPAVRDAVRDGAVAALVRFLSASAEPTGRWVPEHFEARFGPGQDLPPLELSAGDRSIRVSGTIDRIDVDAGAGSAAIVRDYKSGGSGRESRKGARWIQDGEIQVALYMLAAQQLLGLRPAGGLYQPLGDPDLRSRGMYDETIDDLAQTYRNDAASADQITERLGQVTDLAVQLGSQIKAGELTPCPDRCSSEGCRYPWICWAS